MNQFWITTILFSLFVGSPAFADKMDLDTHTAVINQLRTIVQKLDDGDVSKIPSTLRLADLLAERSRLKNLLEVEKNCTNCLQSKQDRQEAIQHYAQIIPKLSAESRGNALLQKAHLHFALGQISETEKIYQLITSEGAKAHTQLILGQTYASLGDVQFQKTQFKEAKISYEKALSIAETPQKGLVHYRLAWCLFNLDQVPQAVSKLEMILQTPKLTEYKNAEGLSQDESFKIDVAKDLASFYARTSITQETLFKLTKLSPISQKQQNLHFLATEADRLGKKKEAALVWLAYQQQSDQKQDALEARVRLMKLKRDMGDLQGSIHIFQNVKVQWNQQGCGNQCEALQTQIRQWIIHWNREEKKIQSLQLTQAYLVYTELFPQDEEMYLLGASAAQQRKQFKSAFELYRRAAIVSFKNRNEHTEQPPQQKLKQEQTLKDSLIGEMDMAETLKNYDLRLQAYSHYLELLPQGERSFDVRFQMAHLYFERKNFEKSSVEFKKLAIEKNVNQADLQKQAASLSLDSLIQLKNESLLEEWSLEYAQLFTKDKTEFYSIHRKSVLNTTAKKINAKKATPADLTKLKNISMLGSTPQEQITLYKNMYLLSVDLKDFKSAEHANFNLLHAPGLNKHDLQSAQQNHIWLAELQLNFAEAYQLTLNIKEKLTADRALKLIWLAQMAHLNPEKHENDFLKLSKNKNLRATVLAHKVQRQPSLLKKYSQELSQSPDVLAKLGLEIYAHSGNLEVLKNISNFKTVQKSNHAGLIARLLNYPELQKEIKTLANHRLSSKTDTQLKKSLELRLKLLSQFETNLKKSITQKDFIVQAINMNVLKYENLRLHDEILSLPVPRGLSAADLQKYHSLLAEQALPYKNKANKVDDKLQALWKNNSWVDTLSQNYREARNEFKPALRQDIQHLARHAPASSAEHFQILFKETNQIPNQKTLSMAQAEVRKNPFDIESVENLKKIESLRGNDIIVSHLEARIGQMKGVLR